MHLCRTQGFPSTASPNSHRREVCTRPLPTQGGTHSLSSDKIASLEQRLNDVESSLRADIQALQRTVGILRATGRPAESQPTVLPNIEQVVGRTAPRVQHHIGGSDIVSRCAITEEQWRNLHSLYVDPNSMVHWTDCL